jgi:energy-coupling factor transport system permease protein
VPIALVAALVLVTARIAHIPRGVLPSVPRWLWFLLFLGALTASFAGGSPNVAIGSVQLGLGGLLNFLHLTVLSIVLLGLGGLVSWTTNVAEIAPAVAKIGRPLRVLRLPIDDWAIALALALRAFPMLIDEFRVLFAARKLRPRDAAGTSTERRHRMSRELIDLLAAAVTVTLRRADEMGDAITARGGAGQISALPTWTDGVALTLVLLLCAVSVWVELATPLATS